MMTLACILQDVVRHVNVKVTQLEAKKRKTFYVHSSVIVFESWPLDGSSQLNGVSLLLSTLKVQIGNCSLCDIMVCCI